MKRILNIAAFALVIVLGSSFQNKASAQYRDDISYQTFYDELSPYGRWIEYPGYGYVWNPSEGPDFRPYSTNGHWVYSDDYEWTWVSDYDWGWAPFHYGRWFNDPYYGWLWVPGYEWSPAWVAWRHGGDYYGWAPIRPGINITISFGGYSPPDFYWSFAPRRYITSRNIYNHCLDYRRNVTIINHTTIINNYNYDRNVFRTGPRRMDVERYTGRISPVRFRESQRPGRTIFRDNEVNIYRPAIRQDNDRRFSPRKFDRYDRTEQNADNRLGRNNDNNREKVRGFERRNNDVNTGNNDLPVRRQNDGPKFERRKDSEVRQPQNNDGQINQDRRRFERKPDDRPVRQPLPQVRNNDQPVRPAQTEKPKFERRNEIRQPQNNDGQRNGNGRRFERTTEPVRQPVPQVRNNQSQRPNDVQQPRKFERKDDANRDNNKNNGRRRF